MFLSGWIEVEVVLVYSQIAMVYYYMHANFLQPIKSRKLSSLTDLLT